MMCYVERHGPNVIEEHSGVIYSTLKFKCYNWLKKVT